VTVWQWLAMQTLPESRQSALATHSTHVMDAVSQTSPALEQSREDRQVVGAVVAVPHPATRNTAEPTPQAKAFRMTRS
jgi:hypothetical protein